MKEDSPRPLGMEVKLSHIRAMVRDVRDDTVDSGDVRAVLADWCEIMGFLETAEGLRAPLISLACNRALTALRMLFGESGAGVQRGSYSAVLGLPITLINPGDTVSVETQAELVMRVRRFYISDTINKDFRVENVRVGKYLLLASADPVPADLFGPLMPDLMDHTVQVSERISVTVTNITDISVVFSGAVLGIDYEQYAKTMPRLQSYDQRSAYPMLHGTDLQLGRADPTGPSLLQVKESPCPMCGTLNMTTYCSTACFESARALR